MITTCAVRPVNFINKRDMKEWNVGMLRHLVHALNGSPVAITVDGQTGHTLVGAKLIGVTGGRGGYNYPHLIVEHDGVRTIFLIFKLGETIIPLESRDAKWTAIKTYSAERTHALSIVQSRHPESVNWWGVWDMKPDLYTTSVSYVPSTGNPAFADRWHEREHFIIDTEGPLSKLTV